MNDCVRDGRTGGRVTVISWDFKRAPKFGTGLQAFGDTLSFF